MKKLLTLAILSLLGMTAWGQGTQHDRTTMRGVVVNHAATPTVSEIAGLVIPGNVGGTATAPSTAPGLAQEATTGGSIADGTYYCVWTGVNLNGETTASPETSLVISAGTGTATIRGNAAGRSWWTGYFAFNLYCGTASGGPYYRVTPWSRTFTVDNNTVSRDANDFVTLTLTGTASMGVADADTVVVSGATGCTDNPNGTFTIYSHVAGTANSSITFKHAGATESGCGGAAISVAFPTAIGLSAQADAHYIHSRLIFTSVPGSGTQPPSTNTATIDDLQVALNTACDFANTRCLKSVQLSSGNDGTGGTLNQYFLSTPLILPNGSKLIGHSKSYLSDTASSGARLFCGDTSAFSLTAGSNAGNVLWPTDGEKIGCVMTLTDDDGVWMENVSISSQAHGVFLMHGSGGAAASSSIRMKNGVWATSGTLCTAPLRMRGKFYYIEVENVELAPSTTADCFSASGKPRGAALILSNMAGGNKIFRGPVRWTIPAKHDGIQNRGGVTDPDRGSNEAGFTGRADVWLYDIQLQHTAGGGTGVACRCNNTRLHTTNVSHADINVSAGTDAMWQFGHDGDGETANVTAINTDFSGVANNASIIKFVGIGGERLILHGGSIATHSTASVDFNSLNSQLISYGSTITGNVLCDPRNATSFINRLTAPGSGSNHVACFGGFASNDANAREGPHMYLQGGLVLQGFRATASDARIWGAWTENGTAFNWYRIDPDTASQKFMSWDTNTVDFFSSDGTTSLFQVDRTNTRSEFGGHVIFPTDNTFDFGASGATRPRAGYFGTSVTSPLFNAGSGTLASAGDIRLSATGTICWRQADANGDTCPFLILANDEFGIDSPGASNRVNIGVGAGGLLLLTTLESQAAGNPRSGTGFIRMANTDSLNWRNAGDTADIAGLTINSSNQVEIGVDTDAAGVKIGDNANTTAIRGILTGTASLDFTALAANTCEVLTITVTGAADGDVVQLGVPTALADVDGATERTVFFGWVSGANTVSVRRCNVTGTVTAEPAAATVRATVTKH